MSPAHSFKTFLSSPRFGDFTKNDRSEFFQYVRNAILHNGETRRDWKIRIDTDRMLKRDEATKIRTINRQAFHAAIEAEFRDLITLLESDDAVARGQFLRRLDAMARLPIDALRNFYFAYGSNLKEEECRRTVPNAEGYGVAFLPGFRLAFTKHSTTTRNCDAATITQDPTSMVWGYVYRMNNQNRETLQRREGGYRDEAVTVYLMPPALGEDPTALEAFTFIATQECANQCGVSAPYLDLVINGAEERGLPMEYRQRLSDLRATLY